MTRDILERRQLWIYLAAIAAGLALGRSVPPFAAPAEAALWPALAVLLFVTFTQVHLADMRLALADRRFMRATLVGNFIAVPLLVAVLLPLLPNDPAILRSGSGRRWCCWFPAPTGSSPSPISRVATRGGRWR